MKGLQCLPQELENLKTTPLGLELVLVKLKSVLLSRMQVNSDKTSCELVVFVDKKILEDMDIHFISRMLRSK